MQRHGARERRFPAGKPPAASRLNAAVSEHATVVDGRRMHTLAAGTGSPVVLIHGLLGIAAGWSGVMERLGANFRTLAPDALGIGHSDRLRTPDAGLAASAGRLARWMDAEELASVDLIGTSHGGAVAMQFAAMFPDRVRRLVLHAPANPFCLQSRPQIRFACTRTGQIAAHCIPHGPAWLHRVALERMYGDPSRIRAGSLAQYVRSLQVPGTVPYVLDILKKWRQDMETLRGVLHRLEELPVLLLWGERDRAVSLASARALRRALPGSQLQVLGGLGHLPFEEDPAAFIAPVLAFLTTEAAPQRRTA